jgi:hypothetical protein
MKAFKSLQDVEKLIEPQALGIIRLAMKFLERQFDYEGAYALDDGGDYLYAALENYNRLFHVYWDNDGDSTAVLEGVKAFLREPLSEWLGCDGDLRFILFTAEYQESQLDAEEAAIQKEVRPNS